ncbi:MAG TPA: ribosome silencing factor [Stellaceae bacterium]|nr:ribosome silencing factor [Stellaceae bacterium]
MPIPLSKKPRTKPAETRDLLALAQASLEDGKAEDVVAIDLAGKSTIADHMLIATGRSQRQVAALAERVVTAVKAAGCRPAVEGLRYGDWVLIDAGDLIVHIFRPEVRAFYNLEKMWGVDFAEPSASAS